MTSIPSQLEMGKQSSDLLYQQRQAGLLYKIFPKNYQESMAVIQRNKLRKESSNLISLKVKEWTRSIQVPQTRSTYVTPKVMFPIYLHRK